MAQREIVRDVGLGNDRPTELTRSDVASELLRELVAHLRQNRTQLREEWVARISETRLLTAMTKEEIFTEATSVYDSYVRLSKPKHSKHCKLTRGIFRNASFHEASKPTKS